MSTFKSTTQIIYRSFCAYKPPAPVVKQLRDQTGSSLKECIKVLTEAEGDISKAKDLLRQRGLAQAGKRGDREAKEGAIGILVNEDRKFGSIVELNCETDFVARTDFFLNSIECLLKTINVHKLKLDSQNSEEIDSILASTKNEITSYEEYRGLNLKDMLQITVSKLQENIKVGNIKTFHADENSMLGQYLHQNNIKPYIGTQGCLTVLKVGRSTSDKLKELSEVADNSAMQILGNKPKYLTRDEVPQDLMQEQVDKVKKDMEKALKGKPEPLQQKMIEGKLKQFLEEHCLYNMSYILAGDNGMSFEQYLEQQNKLLNANLSVQHYELWGIGK